MLSRRAALLAVAAASSVFVTPAFSTETKPFTQGDFAAAQKDGKPIFVAIHATWCPTCKAQKPILSELMAEPKFNNLVYFVVDFDSQKDAVNSVGSWCYILARTDLPDDIAYRLAKALHNGHAALVKRVDQGRETMPQNTVAAAPSPSQIHSGAQKYLREIGALH